jgi:hypothetical protein
MVLTIISLDSIEQLVFVMGKENIVCVEEIGLLCILLRRMSGEQEGKVNRSFFSSCGVQSSVILLCILAS